MHRYEVGERVAALRSNQEGMRFDMTDGGAVMTILFNKPTTKEVKEIKEGVPQFGIFVKNDIIFMLAKFGSLEWMDAPYHVALSKNLTKLEDVEDDQGYGCNVIFADCSTGEIKAIKLIGFSTKFSKALKENIEMQKLNLFDRFNYEAGLLSIMSNYSTTDMVKFADVKYKVRHD